MPKPLSPQLATRLEAWDGTAGATRDAATVVVLRDGPAGRETFLIRRRATMAFAAGKYVFPGGGVQLSDFDPVPWLGPDPGYWAGRFRCRAELARALVVAAVREVFEETGVLLAGADGTVVAGNIAEAGLAEARRAVERKEISFGTLLREHALFMRADLLSPWSHWITPPWEARRFDTRFFVAALPRGQSAGSLTTESDLGQWVGIGSVLQDAREGTVEMMRPTRYTLRELLDIGDRPVTEAAGSRPITTIAPRVIEIDGVRYLDGPSDEEL